MVAVNKGFNAFPEEANLRFFILYQPLRLSESLEYGDSPPFRKFKLTDILWPEKEMLNPTFGKRYEF